MRRSALVVALMLATAGEVRAGVRSDAQGGLAIIAEEQEEFLGALRSHNPAALGVQTRKTRLDLVLGAAINAESESDGTRTASRAEGAGRLTGPEGAWQGLTFFPGEKDAVRIALPVEAGFAFASVSDGGTDQAGLGHLAADLGLDVIWARRISTGFALGVRVRPESGRFIFPTGEGIAEDRGTYGLFDYGLGAVFVIPSVSGWRREVGVGFSPFNDQPDPLNVLGAFGVSALGAGGLGGFTITRKIVFTGGASQSFELTPHGTILGAQGIWAREGGWEVGVAADVTGAETDQLTRTDLNVPGIPPVEQSGLSFALTRIRYTVAARTPFGERDGRRWLAGASLTGAGGRVDQYDFPLSHTVILTQDVVRTVFAWALARERVGVWLVGLGFDLGSDRTIFRDPAQDDGVTGFERVRSGTYRVGAERHLGRRWTIRGGIAGSSEATFDLDPDTPAPGTEDNPRRLETSLSLGFGWQGDKTTWDVLLAARPRSQNPEPVAPRTASGAKLELKVGFSRVW